jgi:uncharacterized protein with HEPN domain
MTNRDYVRLQHMLDASQAAVSHLLDRSREELDHDRLLLNGRTNFKKQTRTSHGEQMRNRLIHVYFDIDYDVVWEAISSEIPKIILELARLLAIQ